MLNRRGLFAALAGALAAVPAVIIGARNQFATGVASPLDGVTGQVVLGETACEATLAPGIAPSNWPLAYGPGDLLQVDGWTTKWTIRIDENGHVIGLVPLDGNDFYSWPDAVPNDYSQGCA